MCTSQFTLPPTIRRRAANHAFYSAILAGFLLGSPVSAANPSVESGSAPARRPWNGLRKFLFGTPPERSRLASEMLPVPVTPTGSFREDSSSAKFELTQWLPLNRATTEFAAGNRNPDARTDESILHIATMAHRSAAYRNVLFAVQSSPSTLLGFLDHMQHGPTSAVIHTDQRSLVAIKTNKVHESVYNDLMAFYESRANVQPVQASLAAAVAETRLGFWSRAQRNTMTGRMFSIPPTNYVKILSTPER